MLAVQQAAAAGEWKGGVGRGEVGRSESLIAECANPNAGRRVRARRPLTVVEYCVLRSLRMADCVELNVGPEIKEKLRCCVCHGYLLCSPIRMLPDGNNICGRCTPSNKDVIVYRNHSLEAVLKNAVFPCKFQNNGCSKRLNFVSDSDHETICTYKSSTSSESVVDSSNNDSGIKSSASTSGQEDVQACSSKDVRVFPKPGSVCTEDTATGSAWPTTPDRCSSKDVRVFPKPGSVCTEDTATGSAWPTTPDRNASTSRTSNFERPHRPSSIASNRSQNLNWNGPHPSHYRHEPYRNYVDNRNAWHNPWLPQGEHVNMYKRRNNLIIIKGGTFYVNW
ncbi:hypothetical protein FQR65_LT13186 [Abscondita terminalis]|nr:hypothetical protein FQR65_LT13186 [Abscondita terminalis]